MRLRGIVLGLAVACGGAGLGAGNAAGAVTIGADLTQSSSPAFDCVGPHHPCTWFQSTPAGSENVTVPFDGSIISWSIGKGAAGDSFSLRVVRPTGSGMYVGAGTSAPVTEPATPQNANGPYAVGLPVRAGEIIGLDAAVGNSALVPGIDGQNCLSDPTPLLSEFDTPDLADGGTARPPTSVGSICAELAIQATVVRLPASTIHLGQCSARFTVSTDSVLHPTAVRYTLDGGAQTVLPTNPDGTTQISIPVGSHRIVYWGADNLGQLEEVHHVQAVSCVPVLSHLTLSKHTISTRGRSVSGRCVAPNSSNRRRRACRRAVKLTVSFMLSPASRVTLKLYRTSAGRRVGGKCVKLTPKNRSRAKCQLVHGLPGSIAIQGATGHNRYALDKRLKPGSYRLTAAPQGGVIRASSFRVTA